MQISKTRLFQLIRESVGSGEQPTHRTLGGEMVSFGCDACVVDMDARIADATHRRDSMSRRTDGREHYNGILKVLRRERRAALKEAEKTAVSESALRHMIRGILKEQVVGYSAPAKSGSGDPGYETIGDTSVPASTGDEDTARKQRSQLSLADKEDLRAQVGQMQQQRSAALKKGDSATANHLGVQLQRMQDVLG
tara:strand:+ start:3585 stop:4169 length:585 start_codon:yes stop_codon:yes gene_type:complete